MAAGVAIACVVAGCGDAGETKAGGVEPVTLRLAAMEGSWAPYAGALEEFGRQVEDLSGGGLRVEVVWEASQALLGGYGPTAERDVAGLIADGDIDLGLVPTRAWDELGVTSLQALQAPFLIESEALLTAVVHGDLPGRMLAGLEPAGVIGLALLPETLRHPVGFDRTFRTLADFAGARLRAPSSRVSFDLLEALGAEPLTIAESGTRSDLAGAESAFVFGTDLPFLGTFTANITFYPKVNTLVVGAEAFRAMTAEQQQVLRQAATNTLDGVGETQTSEAEAAAAYCRAGGGVALAEPADIAALAQAAQPIYAALERDPQTRDFIAEIRSFKDATMGEAELPVLCEQRAGPPPDSTEEVAFPEGVYRNEYPEEFWEEGGYTSQSDVINTLTFQNGQWLHEADEQDVEVPDCGGTYTVEAGRVSLAIAGSPAPSSGCGQDGWIVFSATWEVDGDELQFTDIRSGVGVDPFAEFVWGAKPWTKIG